MVRRYTLASFCGDRILHVAHSFLLRTMACHYVYVSWVKQRGLICSVEHIIHLHYMIYYAGFALII